MGANNQEGLKTQVIRDNAKFISHDLYVNPRLPNSEPLDETAQEYIKNNNDIALIKISDVGIHLTNDDRYLINTICLPKKDELNDGFQDLATAFGYGRWNDDLTFGNVPDYLHKAEILLNDYNSCRNADPGIASFICADINITSPTICEVSIWSFVKA